jgi:hypothetical protein
MIVSMKALKGMDDFSFMIMDVRLPRVAQSG